MIIVVLPDAWDIVLSSEKRLILNLGAPKLGVQSIVNKMAVKLYLYS